MSDNVEDLYLKGFMAYSSKDHSAAKKYWEQVLEMDPNHEKAKQGLSELSGGAAAAKPKKRTSKEVLNEIKQLYAAKKFPEALKLCEKLVQKHPKNADLQGLYKKIEARCQAAPAQPSPADVSAARTTRQLTDDAEASMSEGGDKSVNVERLIQQGVSLYEIQDYESAVRIWEQALQAEPGNRIVQDYINNVKPLIESDSPDSDPAPQAASPAKKLGKEDLVRIYNEAMALFKESQFSAAIEKWNLILEVHPNHKETLVCVERANAALNRESELLAQLEEARDLLSAGKHAEVESILGKISAESPNLEGLDQVRSALDQRKKQITEIRSLELEDSGGNDEEEVETSATDDEITRYFTPEASDGKVEEARQVSRVVRPAKESKPKNKLLLVGLPLLLIVLGVGGYLGFEKYQKLRDVETHAAAFTGLTHEIAWDSIQQKAADFLGYGNDFRDEGDFLMAAYAYQRAQDVGKPRFEELNKRAPSQLSLEQGEEKDRLKETLDQASSEYLAVQPKITVLEVSAQEMDLAEAEFKRGYVKEGSDRLLAVLSNDIDNTNLKDRLGEVLSKLAFTKLAESETDEALQLFRRSLVLSSAYDLPRRHIEVIQRWYHAKITDEEKDQWFFFFMD